MKRHSKTLSRCVASRGCITVHFLKVNYAKCDTVLCPCAFQSATMGDQTVSEHLPNSNACKVCLSSAGSCANTENSLPRHKFDHILNRNENYYITKGEKATPLPPAKSTPSLPPQKGLLPRLHPPPHRKTSRLLSTGFGDMLETTLSTESPVENSRRFAANVYH